MSKMVAGWLRCECAGVGLSYNIAVEEESSDSTGFIIGQRHMLPAFEDPEACGGAQQVRVALDISKVSLPNTEAKAEVYCYVGYHQSNSLRRAMPADELLRDNFAIPVDAGGVGQNPGLHCETRPAPDIQVACPSNRHIATSKIEPFSCNRVRVREGRTGCAHSYAVIAVHAVQHIGFAPPPTHQTLQGRLA